MQDGVLVKSLRQSLQNHLTTVEKLDTMQDGVSVKSLTQSLQQSFVDSRNTRYNAGWYFSQFIKTKLTAIICQQQKY